ncbi:MAG: EVE domain-containing protein [Acidobacteria bacterium]|nr:EVE domain-containing protein [Acidobacteriota bacterium]
MATYLIKWNPKKWQWTTLLQDVEEVRRRGFFENGWSCGNTKRIRCGDRVFLLRTGIAPRGIMASGVVYEEPYEDAHYDEERGDDTALYIGVRFDSMLHPDREGISTIEQLQTGHFANFHWRANRQASPSRLLRQRSWRSLGLLF